MFLCVCAWVGVGEELLMEGQHQMCVAMLCGCIICEFLAPHDRKACVSHKTHGTGYTSSPPQCCSWRAVLQCLYVSSPYICRNSIRFLMTAVCFRGVPVLFSG